MWGKLFKGKNKEEQPLDPSEMVSKAILDMESAIRQSNQSLVEVRKSYAENSEKLHFYQDKGDELQRKAVQAVKKNREDEAKQLLVQKATNEQHIKHYLGLCNAMSETLLKLEGQIVKMKMQLDETKAKKLMLTAQLSNAQNQRDLAEKMKELNISTDAFEAQLFENELAESLAEDSLEKEFAALENFKNPEIEAIKKESEAEERKMKEIEQANKDRKIALMLGINSQKEQKVFIEKQKEQKHQQENLLEGFFVANDSKEKEEEKKSLEAFFEKESPEKDDKNEKLTNFFEKKADVIKEIPKVPEPVNPKEKKLADFFETETPQKQDPLKEKLNTFFEETESKTPPKDPLADFFEKDAHEKNKEEEASKEKTKDAFADFFKKAEKKEDKNKKLDDFFK